MDLAERAASLPSTSGVYLFKSRHGAVLYVGKAKDLRQRVRQYLAGGDGRVQIPALMERTADVETFVTPSVKDALLLENELIKRHKPAFNVLLRDDRQYPGLRLDPRETWPRLTRVRRFRPDGAQYFGPYTSGTALHEVLSNLRRVFPLRSCADPVFRDYRRRGRPCIEYEMKRCAGPCCDRVEASTYSELVRGTQLFLRGRSRELVVDLRRRMDAASRELAFEEAGRLRDRIAAIERTVARQQIVSERPLDRDVFGMARRGSEVVVQLVTVRGGRVLGGVDYAFSDVRIDDGEVMGSFLGQYYGDGAGRHAPREILTSADFDDDGALAGLLADAAERRVAIRAPQRGPARGLVRMAERNAELALEQRLAARASLTAALSEIEKRCQLGRTPRRIECYDISTLQGTLPVASRVVFEDGRPVKRDYRHYRIAEASGGDDIDCLREVIRRRLARADREPLPDLLMVDGGRGQLGVVSAALVDADLNVPALGLAKERDAGSASPRVRRGGGLKSERIFLPGRANPVMLAPSSKGLLLLQRVRDESHRFAIEFQRRIRRRAGLASILEELPGIGPVKRRALLRQLGSLRAVREASEAALCAVPGIGEVDARRIHRFLRALSEAREAEKDQKQIQ